GIGSTCHTCQQRIQAEIVLEGSGCKSLALTLNRYALFCFQRLMQAFGQTTALHGPTGVLVNQYYLIVLHNIFDVAMEQRVSPQRGIDVMQQCEVIRRVEVLIRLQQFSFDQQVLNVLMPFFSKLYLTGFFVNGIITFTAFFLLRLQMANQL